MPSADANSEAAAASASAGLSLAVPPPLVDVPHRVQLPGHGCALYSLGMLMDHWYRVDASK